QESARPHQTAPRAQRTRRRLKYGHRRRRGFAARFVTSPPVFAHCESSTRCRLFSGCRCRRQPRQWYASRYLIDLATRVPAGNGPGDWSESRNPVNDRTHGGTKAREAQTEGTRDSREVLPRRDPAVSASSRRNRFGEGAGYERLGDVAADGRAGG